MEDTVTLVAAMNRNGRKEQHSNHTTGVGAEKTKRDNAGERRNSGSNNEERGGRAV